MDLNITLNMDNAAFTDGNGFEAARILTEIANQMKDHSLEVGDSYPLRDYNGNRVGELTITD